MAPRVLLLHGFLSGPAAWDRLRLHLEGSVETVAPHLPGYGREPGPRSPAGYTLETIAGTLEPLLDREQPSHVVGHSMGAIVALELARRHPGAFERVGVVGLPVYEDRAEAMAFLHRRGLLHRVLLRSDRASHLGCRALFASRWVWWPCTVWVAPRQPRSHLFAAFEHSAAGHAAALDRIVFAGLVPRLAAGVRDPVAVLHGDRDRAAPLEPARALAAERGWEFTAAPGPHQLMIHRPRYLARWVRERVVAPATPPSGMHELDPRGGR